MGRVLVWIIKTFSLIKISYLEVSCVYIIFALRVFQKKQQEMTLVLNWSMFYRQLENKIVFFFRLVFSKTGSKLQ